MPYKIVSMAKNQARKTGLLLFLLPLLIPVLYFGISVVRHRFQYEVVSSVGEFADESAEQKAVVKRLSELLKEYPRATVFKVFSNHPGIRTDGTLFYTRVEMKPPRSWHSEKYGDNRLFLDVRPFALQSAIGNITDEDIHAIAKSSGNCGDVFTRASKRYNRLDAGRRAEEKKLGVDIDFLDRHYPKGTLIKNSH